MSKLNVGSVGSTGPKMGGVLSSMPSKRMPARFSASVGRPMPKGNSGVVSKINAMTAGRKGGAIA